jgi:DNA polymerase I-like protein with 3'-5' exonuclease and polymerase domains
MRIIHTDELSLSERLPLDAEYWTYCGLDCCVTQDVERGMREAYPPITHPNAYATYAFEKALQGPYLDMMLRGFAVDHSARQDAARVLHKRRENLFEKLQLLAHEVWQRPLNPASPKQLQEFFYREMCIEPVFVSKKGIRRISTDREALEKIEEQHFLARPLVSLILLLRDIDKQLQIMECQLNSRGRFDSFYNIAGTETGRPSSRESAFGTGGNAQNIDPDLRYVFIADEGMKLFSIDLEQVEARDVGFILGNLFSDWSMLDACESGDFHTTNAKKIWKERPWTGDRAADRLIAEEIFYRTFSFRDMSKRGGHLTNYMGTSWTAAKSLKVPIKIMDEFQQRYCKGEGSAYPSLPRYWQWVATQLQTKGVLHNLFGRERRFFGRPNSDATLREGIAFIPQSTTGDRMNEGLLRCWRTVPQAQMLAQGFDSITGQLPDDAQFDSRVEKMLKLIEIPLRANNGREYIVPGEAKVGWNWGAATPSNPHGLVKWKKGGEKRIAPRYDLERVM